MARVVQDRQQITHRPGLDYWQLIGSGVGLGVLWWVLTALTAAYVIEPLACRSLDFASQCLAASMIAGNIAVVAVAVVALVVFIRLRLSRPLVVVVGAAVVIWGLGGLLEGVAWLEALLWAMTAYGVTTLLFGLIARIPRFAVMLGVAIFVAVLSRVSMVL